MTTAETNNTDH